ncbi:MAG: hypothetical protein RIQ81_488 [Pseudomonadota bacterium]|jgi:hypothetical protein
MKKTEENRYPHSATLFRFCKEALEIRYEGNVKVIDQDVGAILGYDPADCSHWKKGKKNIRALSTLRGLADHLNVDERLIIDIASGAVGLDEAVFEYRGYGAFSISGRHLENLKKEYFKNPGRWQGDGAQASFETLFDVNRPAILAMVSAIIEQGRFTEAPIYIPEVLQMFPAVSLVAESSLDKPFIAEYTGEGVDLRLTIRHRASDSRSFIRFLSAKELFNWIVRSGHPFGQAFRSSPAEVLDVQSNAFAGLLLVPGEFMPREVERIDSSLDIVQQLASTFWVSKALMNQRLRDYMENLT